MAGLLAGYSLSAEAQQPAMKCETGPVVRTFGKTEWAVYSCDDQGSIAVVSARGNPAAPFVFFVLREAGKYRLEGSGSGDKKASDAAADDLVKLVPADIEALVVATKTAPKRR
jgi:hypothetical protein